MALYFINTIIKIGIIQHFTYEPYFKDTDEDFYKFNDTYMSQTLTPAAAATSNNLDESNENTPSVSNVSNVTNTTNVKSIEQVQNFPYGIIHEDKIMDDNVDKNSKNKSSTQQQKKVPTRPSSARTSVNNHRVNDSIASWISDVSQFQHKPRDRKSIILTNATIGYKDMSKNNIRKNHYLNT